MKEYLYIVFFFYFSRISFQTTKDFFQDQNLSSKHRRKGPNLPPDNQVCLFRFEFIKERLFNYGFESADNWKPATKTDQVIQSLVALVNDPEPEHPLRGDLAEGA